MNWHDLFVSGNAGETSREQARLVHQKKAKP